MHKYIKLEEAIGVCRERQIIEGNAITGIRYPTPDEIINDLSDLPTIEVREGEWLQGNPLVRPICSVCGEPCIGLHGFNYKASDYCPNCGAKMKGADDDNG